MEIETAVKQYLQTDFELRYNDENNAITSVDLSELPLEVLEQVLSFLTDPISQRRLSQVNIPVLAS